MFNDKLSFYPIGKGDRTEMAFPLISRINSPGGFWSIVPMKKLEIYLSDQKLTFTVSRTMSTVLLAGMEKTGSCPGRRKGGAPMSGDTIGMIVVYGFIGAVVVVMIVVGSLSAKKGGRICRELVANNFQEMRLVNDCWLSSGFLPDMGILALLSDRLVFALHPVQQAAGNTAYANHRGEGPQNAHRSPTADRPGSLKSRRTARKSKLTMNMYIMTAWVTALEKSAPMLAAQKIG